MDITCSSLSTYGVAQDSETPVARAPHPAPVDKGMSVGKKLVYGIVEVVAVLELVDDFVDDFVDELFVTSS